MWSALRSPFRSLTRDRGFAILAIALIALTGGATTAVYAVIDAVMLAPMPFADEQRTVVVWAHDPARATPVVEVALGASRGMLVRQALLETAMLAVAGAIGGFGVAWVIVRVR